MVAVLTPSRIRRREGRGRDWLGRHNRHVPPSLDLPFDWRVYIGRNVQTEGIRRMPIRLV
jgi:hypothetical protein